MNSKKITWLLAKRYGSPFQVRRHIAVVPNVSWSILPWEADLLVLAKSNYLTEIEIKISMSDWKADASKANWRAGVWQWEMVKRFYYAAPRELAVRWQEVGFPDSHGVVAIDDESVEVIKPARPLPGHRKLSDAEVLKILRLAAIKAWGLEHRIQGGAA